MANKYHCTITGKSYTEATIQANLSKAYKEVYEFEPLGCCVSCGEPATCSAHIIARARCKQLHLVSLIWDPVNFFRSCFRCNTAVENISGPEIKSLRNFDHILKVIETYDPERYLKLTYDCNNF